ncbi:MAG: immunoglobulin domain-containing protein [Verrucomicrobia bacterium]|nr:immunoglobulin domain-containing protein [Verrucomicrobiota bacterium]
MKKALTLIVLVLTPTMAFAQGTVVFDNNSSGLVRLRTIWTDPTSISVPVGGAQVELFAAPVGTGLTRPLPGIFFECGSLANFLAANPGWLAIATTGISPVEGWFNGGPVTLPVPPGPGATVSYFIVGWSGEAGSTLDQAIASGAYIGSSVACPAPNYQWYQWYFNGVSIPEANSSSFQMSNAQLTDAGTYWVVVSSSDWGVHTSGSATLTVLTEPIITSAPQSQTAFVGSSVSFRASATGTAPMAYRWLLSATNALSGGTNSVLRLTNVQPAQAGAYTLVVTNVAGAVTSTPAMLAVIPPVERRMVPALSLLGQPGSLMNLENADAVGSAPAWVTFDSTILANTSQWYFDVATPLPPQRFYRAWQAGVPTIIPSLNLYMIPAITLFGKVGSSVRVDRINQFGPIDAWVTLDTVTLTNSPQLYFDVSAISQPPRLWRLVPVR